MNTNGKQPGVKERIHRLLGELQVRIAGAHAKAFRNGGYTLQPRCAWCQGLTRHRPICCAVEGFTEDALIPYGRHRNKSIASLSTRIMAGILRRDQFLGKPALRLLILECYCHRTSRRRPSVEIQEAYVPQQFSHLLPPPKEPTT